MSGYTTPTAARNGGPDAPDPDACVGVVELVTDYLEGTLDPRVRARFEAHLAECDGCDIYLDQVRETIAAAGRVHLVPMSPATLDSLLRAFRAARAP